MSLQNKNNSPKPSTIIIKEVVRNRKTESFGDSFFHDMSAAMGPAANITNSVYRNKALKAIERRNRILQNESEYVNMLANMNVGNNFSVSGNMSESNFFDYISRYCEMEIMVHKRNAMLGNVSPEIEEKLKNPPNPNMDHFARYAYCNSIMAICKKDMAKVGMAKAGAWLKDKLDK